MATIDQNKIRRTCRWVSGFALILLILIPSFLIYFWIDPLGFPFGPGEILKNLLTAGYVTAATFTLQNKIIGLLISAIPVAAMIIAGLQIRRLMGMFAAGRYITAESARALRLIAICLMALPFLRILGDTLLILALTLGNPPGDRLLSISLGSDDLIAFLFGLLIWMITRAFEVEQERAEEHAEII